MKITEKGEAFLATLPPDRAAFVRSQLERCREPTEDELRRLAGLLGLRQTAPPPHGRDEDQPR